MKTKTGELVWFDIPVKDFEAAKAFYGELLGWKFEPMGPDYWMIKADRETIGGLRKPSGTVRDTDMPVMYFAVDKLDPAVTHATRLGGTPVGQRVNIPDDIGSFHLFRDKDHNLIGIWAKS